MEPSHNLQADGKAGYSAQTQRRVTRGETTPGKEPDENVLRPHRDTDGQLGSAELVIQAANSLLAVLATR